MHYSPDCASLSIGNTLLVASVFIHRHSSPGWPLSTITTLLVGQSLHQHYSPDCAGLSPQTTLLIAPVSPMALLSWLHWSLSADNSILMGTTVALSSLSLSLSTDSTRLVAPVSPPALLSWLRQSVHQHYRPVNASLSPPSWHIRCPLIVTQM